MVIIESLELLIWAHCSLEVKKCSECAGWFYHVLSEYAMIKLQRKGWLNHDKIMMEQCVH
jgi:delta-aminolevulinic acid dehydratase/porphobilinogen synthase